MANSSSRAAREAEELLGLDEDSVRGAVNAFVERRERTEYNILSLRVKMIAWVERRAGKTEDEVVVLG